MSTRRKISDSMLQKIINVWSERQRRKRELERLPTDAELAAEAGVTVIAIRKVIEREQIRIEEASYS